MITNPQVPLSRLALSLSEAFGWAHPSLSGHREGVAYIGIKIAREMGLHGRELSDIFLAAVLHDIGLLITKQSGPGPQSKMPEDRTCLEAGFESLRGQPLFRNAAEIILNLHTPWDSGRGEQRLGRHVPMGSYILSVADAADLAIDRSVPVITQSETVRRKTTNMAGATLHADCVEAFCSAAKPESFWLDATSDRAYSVLLKQVDWMPLLLDEAATDSIAEIFASLVDGASVWTATHSAAVAAVAVELAKRLNLSQREQILMRVAGHLHDLGKLTVSASTLDKAGKPTPEEWAIIKAHPYHTFRLLDTIGGLPQITEWAAYHHERADGTGYPFRISGRDLTLGSRIMAVADVFAAITEDRPYRKAMGRTASVNLLGEMADSGSLDSDVVHTIRQNYDEIASVCSAERANYAMKQNALADRIAASARDQHVRITA